MAQEPTSGSGDRSVAELRGLHELARQLLPLETLQETARDGLLCIAGITGIGSGAVLWREDGPASRSFELLSHFGLGPARLRARYRLSAEALGALAAPGAFSLDTVRRRPVGRSFAAALEPLSSHIGDAWVLALAGDQQPRGIVLLGRSLVTGELLAPASGLADLAEILRLALVGRGGARAPEARSSREAPLSRQVAGTKPHAGPAGVQRVAAGGRGTAARFAALRRAHPATAEFVGDSPAALQVLEEIVMLASTDYAVLVVGETGTGKEMAARLLHRLSRRGRGPFEAVDCSSIPPELIESELFGHVKGAFTGAVRDFRGAFERADGGTVLLDEIGDMDLRSQTRLLRVLQEGTVRRVGGDRPISVDVRVVAATNRDLSQRVRDGRFREDLYYRIHVCLLHLPPLRERGEDRIVLFDRMMRQHARELGRAPRAMDAESRRRLRAEPFPGNVRQMQNVVRQLLVQGAGRGPVEIEELERVLARSALGRARAAPPDPDPSDRVAPPSAPPTPPQGWVPSALPRGVTGPQGMDPEGRELGGDVEDVGAWVLEQLRTHRFNLLAAARHLQALRRLGAPREAVPVYDRGALDYYLCGEFYRRLVLRDYALDPVIADLAGTPALVPRLRRKVRAFVRPLARLAPGDRARLRQVLAEGYGRLPERYQLDLEAAAGALLDGRWQAQSAL